MLILFSNMVKAEESKASSCAEFDQLAAIIMEHRQKGTPLSKMVEVMPDETFLDLLIIAYETPQFSGEKHRQRMVDEFRNKVYLMCLKR